GFNSLDMDAASVQDRVWQRIALTRCWICRRFSFLSPGKGILALHKYPLASRQAVAEHMAAALEQRLGLLGAASLGLLPVRGHLRGYDPTWSSRKASTSEGRLASGHSCRIS